MSNFFQAICMAGYQDQWMVTHTLFFLSRHLSHAIWTRCSPGRCFLLAGTTEGEEGDADIVRLHTLAKATQRPQGGKGWA